MAYVAILLITLGFLATGKWPSLAVAYGEFIIGLLSATTIFTGANTAVKWMAHSASTKRQSGQVIEEMKTELAPVEQAPEQPKK